MGTVGMTKRLCIRYPGMCAACGRALPVGSEALWEASARELTCLECIADHVRVAEGVAGASALRQYQRLRAGRESRARARLGAVGGLLVRVVPEPQTVRAWRQGAHGEALTASRLARHLHDTSVRVLHDRLIPGRRRSNIDHLAIGPGGVTVIDTKTYKGAVRVERVGGLFSPRRSALMINGRDRTRLVQGVEQQVEKVRSAIASLGLDVDVRAALCFPRVGGLPLLPGRRRVRDVLIDGPKPVARLACRPGLLEPAQIELIRDHLGRAFPPA